VYVCVTKGTSIECVVSIITSITTGGRSKRSKGAASDRPIIMSDRTVTNGRRPDAIMTCRVSLRSVCSCATNDGVKSSRQQRQPGGTIDVWLSVNTVIIIVIILYITVRRLQSLLTRHTITTTNSNAHGVAIVTFTSQPMCQCCRHTS